MNPRLFDISSGLEGMTHLSLPSYFTMVTIGFIIGAILIHRFARLNKLDARVMFDFVVWMAIWGVVGSRILHVLADGHFWDYVHVCTNPALVDWKVDVKECKVLGGVWDAARGVCHPAESNCFAFADLTAGGFAFYGGFIAAGLFAARYVSKHRLPAGKVVDMAAWLLMLGLAWGRMGCMLAGCCFGARTDSALGVVFPPGSPASRQQWEEGLLSTYRADSLAVHYTQAYEAAAGIAIAAFACLWIAPRKRFDGEVFCVAASLYAVTRFLVEFLRRDERGGLLGLSTSQIIAVCFLIALAWLWTYFRQRSAALLAATSPGGEGGQE